MRLASFDSMTCKYDLPDPPQGVTYVSVTLTESYLVLFRSDGQTVTFSLVENAGALQLLAFPRACSFPADALLDTSVVRAMSRRRTYSWILLIMFITACVLYSYVNFVAEQVPIRTDGRSERTLVYHRLPVVWFWIALLLHGPCLFLVLHRIMPKVFFYVLCSFECLVPISFSFLSSILYLRRDFQLAVLAGEFNVHLGILYPCILVISTTWMTILVSIDGVRMQRISKLCLLFLAAVWLAWVYLNARFELGGSSNSWLNEEACWFTHCTTDKGAFLACIAQTFLFLSKHWLRLAIGNDFCVLQPNYVLLGPGHITGRSSCFHCNSDETKTCSCASEIAATRVWRENVQTDEHVTAFHVNLGQSALDKASKPDDGEVEIDSSLLTDFLDIWCDKDGKAEDDARLIKMAKLRMTRG